MGNVSEHFKNSITIPWPKTSQRKGQNGIKWCHATLLFYVICMFCCINPKLCDPFMKHLFYATRASARWPAPLFNYKNNIRYKAKSMDQLSSNDKDLYFCFFITTLKALFQGPYCRKPHAKIPVSPWDTAIWIWAVLTFFPNGFQTAHEY